jgi:hypothetical protein
LTVSNNPMNERTKVYWPDKIEMKEIRLNDLLGHTQYYYPSEGQKELELTNRKLNSGSWMIQAITKRGDIISQRLIKQ